jgi:hypothetical protein
MGRFLEETTKQLKFNSISFYGKKNSPGIMLL